MNETHFLNDWLAFGGLLSLQITLLLGAAWLTTRILRCKSAAERHVVWTIAVVGALSLPALHVIVPSWHLTVPVPNWAGVAVEEVPTERRTDTAGTQHYEEVIANTPLPAAVPEREKDVASEKAAGPAANFSFGGLAFILWIAGVLATIAFTLLAVVRVHVEARRWTALQDPALRERVRKISDEIGLRRPVRLLEGEADAMPLTFGFTRAFLLLPSTSRNWSPARQESVLRHELAHIRRCDTLTQLVADIGCALYWFHPMMWMAARQMRVEREHACDDVVLVSGARASDYAAELVEIARTMRGRVISAPAAIAMARPSRLRTRISAVLETRERTDRLSGKLLVAFSAAALALSTTIAALAPVPSISGALPANAASFEIDAEGAMNTIIAEAAPVEGTVTTGDESHADPPEPAPGTGVSRPRLQDSECWQDSGNTFTRTVNRSDDHTRRGGYSLIQQRIDDIEVCLWASPPIPFDEGGADLTRILDGDRIELAARSSGRQYRLEIAGTGAGRQQTWYVNGAERPFDQQAADWRDAMLAVLGGYAEISRIRGEVATLKGEIATIRGRDATLRGEIATIRGQVSTMQGRIATIRGEEASLRGEIASVRGNESTMRGQIATIKGQEAAMRGEIATLRGRISTLESARRATGEEQTRARLGAEVEEVRQMIREVERRIAEFDADSRIAEVERRIGEYDAATKVREVEDQIRGEDVAERIRQIEEEIRAFDADARVREVERRMANANSEEAVAEIERKINALDADRRIRQIEERMAPEVRRLGEIQNRIR